VFLIDFFFFNKGKSERFFFFPLLCDLGEGVLGKKGGRKEVDPAGCWK